MRLLSHYSLHARAHPQSAVTSGIQERIISNHWMRLSRIWRILQVEESVIHRSRRPRWITPSEICRILHVLRKPNSIIALLFIWNIFFAQTCKLYSRPFLFLLSDTTLCPGFLGQWFNNLWRQWFNNLQWAPLLTSFWRQWFNNLQRTALLTSLVQCDRILGQQQLFIVNYACGTIMYWSFEAICYYISFI